MGADAAGDPPSLPVSAGGTGGSGGGGWRLSVSCPEAERVLLVQDNADGMSQWQPMTRRGKSGLWELFLPGDGFGRGLRYYTVERGAVMNCGTAGLSAQRFK